MWNKPIKVFKGVDNTFDIQIQDFDQQPVPVNPYVFRFKAADRNELVVLSKDLKFREGFKNRLALDIDRLEISDLEPGLYKWALSIEDDLGAERPLYVELNGSVEGTLEIADWSYADNALASAVLDTWLPDTDTTTVTNDIISGVVTLEALTGSQLSPLHTAAIFKESGADGILNIEASNGLTLGAWTSIHNLLLTAGSTSTYVNFYGVFERIRFRFTPTEYSTGTMEKIYYRLF